MLFNYAQHDPGQMLLPSAFTSDCTAYTTPGALPHISESRHKKARSIISMQTTISIALINFIFRHMTVKVCPPYANQVHRRRICQIRMRPSPVSYT